MLTVSVIVPTYRHRDYVRATLDSVFAQTFTDYEVIVVNDGSPDDTADVLRPLVDAGRIRYVEQTNAGQAAARNRGLAMAGGEFVAFLDDDDIWPPDKLAWQVETLRTTDAIAVGGIARTIIDGELHGIAENGECTPLRVADLFGHNPFKSPGQVLIRTAAARAVGGFDVDLWGTDDMDLWIRLTARGVFWHVGRVALDYRLHATNASHDWRRMLANTRKTMAKNLPLVPADERSTVLRSGEWHQYLYAGAPRIQTLWSLRPSRWWNAARAAGEFIRPATRDPRLALAIARELVPISVRRAIKR